MTIADTATPTRFWPLGDHCIELVGFSAIRGDVEYQMGCEERCMFG